LRLRKVEVAVTGPDSAKIGEVLLQILSVLDLKDGDLQVLVTLDPAQEEE
jgi:hypothetical protein